MTEVFEKPWPGVETAGRLCLSYVNTLDWRLREAPAELFKSYEDVLRWAWTVEALTREQARSLRGWAEAHTRAAARGLEEAITVREAMASVFLAAGSGKRLPAAPLERLDEACLAARGAQALRAAPGAAIWKWRNDPPEPDRPLWAAALDASDLLTTTELRLVRQCGDAECGWFFLDTSRNRSRRWCSMESCGNRNKARSFYKRSRRT